MQTNGKPKRKIGKYLDYLNTIKKKSFGRETYERAATQHGPTDTDIDIDIDVGVVGYD